MSEVFRTQAQVRFAHCDPAGWMFYPRAFELINGVVEDWFAGPLAKPFSALHVDDGLGIPTVHLEADFRRPSRLGDILDLELSVAAIGRSSVGLVIAASARDVPRFDAKLRIAFVRLAEAKSVPIPAQIRASIATYQPG